jgi:hypothetical protein
VSQEVDSHLSGFTLSTPETIRITKQELERKGYLHFMNTTIDKESIGSPFKLGLRWSHSDMSLNEEEFGTLYPRF